MTSLAIINKEKLVRSSKVWNRRYPWRYRF